MESKVRNGLIARPRHQKKEKVRTKNGVFLYFRALFKRRKKYHGSIKRGDRERGDKGY